MKEERKPNLALVFKHEDYLCALLIEDPLLQRRLIGNNLVQHALVICQLADKRKNQRDVCPLGMPQAPRNTVHITNLQGIATCISRLTIPRARVPFTTRANLSILNVLAGWAWGPQRVWRATG